MKSRKSLNYGIGFPDSRVVSYESKNDDLIIFLEQWNAKILKITFIECIFFQTTINWNICDICEIDASENLEKALKIYYEVIPKDYPFRIFQFIDNEDATAIEVVSRSFEISIQINSPLK